MTRQVVFTNEEYSQIQSTILDLRDSIWDCSDPADRAVLFSILGNLKKLLGMSDVV